VISRSLSTVWLTSGRRTLTTTRAPDIKVAAWTWAMDAAAIGSRSKLANSSLTSAPSSDRRPPRAYGSSPRRARILLICQ
jgi:hypothetical protein